MAMGFELLDRDGLARLGRLTTLHGTVRTPVLLPVLHPDPARQAIPSSEIQARFHAEAVMTSSYILRRQADLSTEAQTKGIHSVLGFPGTVVTDSGAFQQHVYGGVEATPPEILEFQNAIGTDVATPLDLFVEPEVSHAEASRGVEETARRVEEARKLRGERLLAVPVQGGLHDDLRRRSAELTSSFADVLAVGGIVPLMDSYRFAELLRMLCRLRPHLPPEKPLHLYGLGHPMLFAFGALLGTDIFDTASYYKFAVRSSLQFPTGSIPLSSVREEFCGCALCSEVPLQKVAELPAPAREKHLALHNLEQCFLEIARVRQAIREGELWDLVEQRASGHPALMAAYREVLQHPEVFLPTEPPSRRRLFLRGPLSLQLPPVVRFQRHLHEYTSRPSRDRSSSQWRSTPLGKVPPELAQVYPVGCVVAPEEYLPRDRGTASAPPAPVPSSVSAVDPMEQALGILEWTWGESVRQALNGKSVQLRHSKGSGRLREIFIDGIAAFVVGNDGLPHPTFRGGEFLHATLPAGHHRVTASDDAQPFVETGRSLFAQHVLRASPDVVPGAYVLIVNQADVLLAVGRCLLGSSEMVRFRHGVAVRPVAHRKPATSSAASGDSATGALPLPDAGPAP